jgi:hypothetical protein
MDDQKILKFLKLKGRFLYHREGQELEFKEQFNLAGLAEYLKDFAAFANNKGGYLIFGIKNSPRIPVGLNKKSLNQFKKIDPEKITGYLLETFSSSITWEQNEIKNNGKTFGIFYIQESNVKPIIAKLDEGKEQTIKNGEIYYRYGGRTQKIQYAELENIILNRVEKNNKQWMDLMSKIAVAGPQNAAILDTKKSIIEKGSSKILIIDENLSKKIKFIKSGEFNNKKGEATLKLIGDVVPVKEIEVIKKIKADLLKEYPLSATDIANEIRKKLPTVGKNKIWKTINETGIKNNTDYSTYSFLNKKQRDEYENTGLVRSSVPNIYNEKALDFLVKILSE